MREDVETVSNPPSITTRDLGEKDLKVIFF